MKNTLFILLIIISFSTNAQTNPPDSIAQHVKFLEKQQLSAKDYIIGLFDRYDIVILCERIHDELTQYQLIVAIISDKKFQEQVGDVFMEIGGSNFDAQINDYLFSSGLSKDQAVKRAIEIQRDMSWYPLWQRYNYHYFLTSMYDINQTLSKENKIRLHPTDMAIDWKEIKTLEDVKNKIANGKVQLARDSIMGSNIVSYIEKDAVLTGKRKKHFVIMNTAHAVEGIWKFGNDETKSAASYVFEKFGDKTANVLINMESLLNIESTTENLSETKPILDGKLDAAFEFLGIDDKGFDISGSPLENQKFENTPMSDTTVTNEEVFTGYVFYKSFPKHEHVNGVPAIVDSDFKPEMIRRWDLWYQLINQKPSPEEVESVALGDNIVVKKNPYGLNTYWNYVMKWLVEGI